MDRIRSSIETAITYLREHPDEGRLTDIPATATIEMASASEPRVHDGSVHAGPLRTRVRYRLAAEGVPAERLEDIVEWAEAHSPVADALRRAVPVDVEVEVGARALMRVIPERSHLSRPRRRWIDSLDP
jgi:hypothetical protein